MPATINKPKRKRKQNPSVLQSVTCNLTGNGVRHEDFEGRPHLVVPVAMLTEGVHAGSNGPLYYPEAELAKTTAVWNTKPIVVYHPQMNGVGVSACDPTILSTRKVGEIFNTTWDGKLRAEAYLDIEACGRIDERILETLEAGEMMEVSTGLFTDNHPAAPDAEWNGEQYTATAMNYRPDHLALLPDKIGACSIADGAGLLQTNAAMSHSNIHEQIRDALAARHPDSGVPNTAPVPGPWIADIYTTFVVYEMNGNLYQLGYTIEDNTITLDPGTGDEVVRVTEYRSSTGEFVGNATVDYHPLAGAEAPATENEDTMNRQELVDALIANTETAWAEGDREYLMGLEDTHWEKQFPTGNDADPAAPAPAPAPAANVATPAAPTVNAAPAPAQTLEGFMAVAPPEVAAVINEGLQASAAARQVLCDTILANEQNTLTPQELGALPMDTLRAMGSLAANAAAPAPTQPNYQGQSVPNPAPTGNADPEEPMVMPTMNFGE